MLNDIKLMLGDAASNFTDAYINLLITDTEAEVIDYCNVEQLDDALEVIIKKIVVYKLNRMNTEGLTSQGYSGVSESYIDGYPEDIMKALNKKRKIKVI